MAWLVAYQHRHLHHFRLLGTASSSRKHEDDDPSTPGPRMLPMLPPRTWFFSVLVLVLVFVVVAVAICFLDMTKWWQMRWHVVESSEGDGVLHFSHDLSRFWFCFVIHFACRSLWAERAEIIIHIFCSCVYHVCCRYCIFFNSLSLHLFHFACFSVRLVVSLFCDSESDCCGFACICHDRRARLEMFEFGKVDSPGLSSSVTFYLFSLHYFLVFFVVVFVLCLKDQFTIPLMRYRFILRHRLVLYPLHLLPLLSLNAALSLYLSREQVMHPLRWFDLELRKRKFISSTMYVQNTFAHSHWYFLSSLRSLFRPTFPSVNHRLIYFFRLLCLVPPMFIFLFLSLLWILCSC